MRYRVRNFNQYQPYGNGRGASWCKLHRSILRKRYARLSSDVWRLGMELVILAFDEEPDDDGYRWLDCDPGHLSWVLGRKVTQEHLDTLERHNGDGFIVPDPEEETNQETTGEETAMQTHRKRVQQSSTKPVDFDAFWAAYPRKVGKAAALKAWKKEKPPIDTCLSALKAQKAAGVFADKKYSPHPATWINAGRWEDEVEVSTGPVVDKTSGGVQWRGGHSGPTAAQQDLAADLADSIEDTGLSIGFRMRAAYDAINAHPGEQDAHKLAEIARRCAWDWQEQINSEAWKRRQEEGAA